MHAVTLRLASILLLIVAAACGGEQPEAESVEIEWGPLVEATRAIDPAAVDLLVLIERNEEFESGHLLQGTVDLGGRLLDLANGGPVSGNTRSRVVVNGDDAYFLTDVESVVERLPEPAVIIHTTLDDAVAMGSVTLDMETLTGALGLLDGAIATRLLSDGVYEVDLDSVAAVDALSPAERQAVPMSLASMDETLGIAEVTLSDAGDSIARYRVRITGDGPDGEILLTVDYRIAPVTTPLTFDPPPAEDIVELDDHADARPPLAGLGPGF